MNALPATLSIRPEHADDIASIAGVTEAAFRDHPHSQQTEVAIIAELRRHGALAVSLVAESKGQVIGHVAMSPVTIADGTAGWFGLGPVAVDPTWQRRGVGSALITAGLCALRLQSAGGCVVLGEPECYTRFGFRQRTELVLADVPPEYFLVLSFTDRYPRGEVHYHPAFSITSESMSTRQPVVEILDPRVVEIYRKMTPQQRLARAAAMWRSARVIVRGAVQCEHPDWTEEQVLREVANRLSHGETERVRRGT